MFGRSSHARSHEQSEHVRAKFANPDPYPTPTPYKGSTVSYYPYLPVLPKPVGGESETGYPK